MTKLRPLIVIISVHRRTLRYVFHFADQRDRNGGEGVRVRDRVVRVGAGVGAAPAGHAAVVRRRGRGALVRRRTLLPAPPQRQRRGARGRQTPDRVHARRRAQSGRIEDHESETRHRRSGHLKY